MRKHAVLLLCLTFWWLALTSTAMAETNPPPTTGTTTPIAATTPSNNVAPTYGGNLLNLSVHEDTEQKIPIRIDDPNGDLMEVKLEVKNGTLKVTETKTGIADKKNDTKKMTLKGLQKDINDTLNSLVYEGNRNYVGPDTLNIIFTDEKNNEGKKDIQITVNHFNASAQACDPNTKGGFGFWKHMSAGPTLSYSLIQYNLADKKSSLNTTAAGGGISFRYYSTAELTRFGTMMGRPKFSLSEDGLAGEDLPENTPPPSKGKKWAENTIIDEVPADCRAKTFDVGEEKIHSWISVSPTMYAFQEKNADNFGVQLAVNVGFLDDIFSIGAGWNLSGDNAGEWFLLVGPSIAFGQ